MTSVVEKSGVEKIVFPKNLGESGIYPFMHIRINERQGQEKEGWLRLCAEIRRAKERHGTPNHHQRGRRDAYVQRERWRTQSR